MQVKKIVPSREDSYEWLCHNAQKSRFLLDLTKDKSLNKHLSDPRMERFIGKSFFVLKRSKFVPFFQV
jgi:hypothetical protein